MPSNPPLQFVVVYRPPSSTADETARLMRAIAARLAAAPPEARVLDAARDEEARITAMHSCTGCKQQVRPRNAPRDARARCSERRDKSA